MVCPWPLSVRLDPRKVGHLPKATELVRGEVSVECLPKFAWVPDSASTSLHPPPKRWVQGCRDRTACLQYLSVHTGSVISMGCHFP